jgi:hypothetical protein
VNALAPPDFVGEDYFRALEELRTFLASAAAPPLGKRVSGTIGSEFVFPS